MLSERFYEMWGLTFEGGEERTYAIDAEVRKLEAVVLEAERIQTEANLAADTYAYDLMRTVLRPLADD